MLRNITMWVIRTLFTGTMNNLQMEKINEINNLGGIYLLSIIIIISLAIYILSFKMVW